MAPLIPQWISQVKPGLLRREAFAGMSQQWTKPNDIFSVLLILGGDIVQHALAQLVGSRSHITPVAFSFGWVAYAVSSVVSVIGEGRLMPLPDNEVTVINVGSGYKRDNKSWILGRVSRDWTYKKECKDFALVVTIAKVSRTEKAGILKLDKPWMIGIAIMISQIILAAIPGILYGSWSCFVITSSGTMLSLAHGALPQWRWEKWSCRSLAIKEKPKSKATILVQGNGSPHALVIISEGVGLDLEDLACGRKAHIFWTTPAVIALSLLWIVLLIAASGIKDNPWFLLLVGGLGICQNVYAAGCRRKPEAYGIHIEKVVDILPEEKLEDDGRTRHHSNKVFAILKKVDEFPGHELGIDRQRPNKTVLGGVGLALLPIFFPGKLRSEEKTWEEERFRYYAENQVTRDAMARRHDQDGEHGKVEHAWLHAYR